MAAILPSRSNNQLRFVLRLQATSFGGFVLSPEAAAQNTYQSVVHIAWQRSETMKAAWVRTRPRVQSSGEHCTRGRVRTQAFPRRFSCQHRKQKRNGREIWRR